MTPLEKLEAELQQLRDREMNNYLSMSQGQRAKLSRKIDDLAQRRMKLLHGIQRQNVVIPVKGV